MKIFNFALIFNLLCGYLLGTLMKGGGIELGSWRFYGILSVVCVFGLSMAILGFNCKK